MRNRFLSSFWTRENLEKFLLAVEQSRLTGAVVRVRTGPSQETEFDPKSVDLDKLHDEIAYALFLIDPELFPNPLLGRVMKASTVYL